MIYIPVPMRVWSMQTFWDRWTWIPSVLGLFSGAVMVRLVACTHVELSKAMCFWGLSMKVRSLMYTLLESDIVNPCKKKKYMYVCMYVVFVLVWRSSNNLFCSYQNIYIYIYIARPKKDSINPWKGLQLLMFRCIFAFSIVELCRSLVIS